MQPPTIPHQIDGYQVDKNFNKCLDCHARDADRRSRRRCRSAPRTTWTATARCSPTSRRGATSARSATSRRTTCKPLVGNRFEDVDALAERAPRRQAPRRRSSDGDAHDRARSSATGRSSAGRALHFSLGLPDDRRLHRRHRLLGRLQHRAWSSPTPRRSAPAATRCATTSSPSCKTHDPLHQPLAACARSAPTATCRTTGPTRSRARCRRRRRSGARSSAPSTRARSSVDKRLELAQHEWARLKANDSLECRNCHELRLHGLHAPEPRARRTCTRPTWPTGEKTCIDCHKGIAHRLPDMGAALPH